MNFLRLSLTDVCKNYLLHHCLWYLKNKNKDWNWQTSVMGKETRLTDYLNSGVLCPLTKLKCSRTDVRKSCRDYCCGSKKCCHCDSSICWGCQFKSQLLHRHSSSLGKARAPGLHACGQHGRGRTLPVVWPSSGGCATWRMSSKWKLCFCLLLPLQLFQNKQVKLRGDKKRRGECLKIYYHHA